MTLLAASGSSRNLRFGDELHLRHGRRRNLIRTRLLALGACASLLFAGPALADCADVPQLRLPRDFTILKSWRNQTRRSPTWSAFIRSGRVLNGSDPGGFAQVFEAQLQRAGWDEIEADTSNGVFVSTWRVSRQCPNAMGLVDIAQQPSGPYFVEVQIVTFPPLIP
jgi:hypothetical protein